MVDSDNGCNIIYTEKTLIDAMNNLTLDSTEKVSVQAGGGIDCFLNLFQRQFNRIQPVQESSSHVQNTIQQRNVLYNNWNLIDNTTRPTTRPTQVRDLPNDVLMNIMTHLDTEK